MTMAAHVPPSLDVFADARRDLESLFKRLTEAGACSHVVLGGLITEGLARVATRTFQGHLDALFAEEREEVDRWVRPEGSEVRALSIVACFARASLTCGASTAVKSASSRSGAGAADSVLRALGARWPRAR